MGIIYSLIMISFLILGIVVILIGKRQIKKNREELISAINQSWVNSLGRSNITYRAKRGGRYLSFFRTDCANVAWIIAIRIDPGGFQLEWHQTGTSPRQGNFFQAHQISELIEAIIRELE